jgi:hypothetical protein
MKCEIDLSLPFFLGMYYKTFFLAIIVAFCSYDVPLAAFIISEEVSICDIGKITFHLMMAKYLPMLPKGKMVQ